MYLRVFGIKCCFGCIICPKSVPILLGELGGSKALCHAQWRKQAVPLQSSGDCQSGQGNSPRLVGENCTLGIPLSQDVLTLVQFQRSPQSWVRFINQQKVILIVSAWTRQMTMHQPLHRPQWPCCVAVLDSHSMSCSYHLYTLLLFNIAMGNGPFIGGLPMKNGDFPWLC